jgi:polyribonucleotide nucleotidyltransferase
MDLKVNGLPYSVMEEALNQAKDGRLHILNEISKTLDAPRNNYKEHAPRLIQIEIPGEFIGAVIGPGGKIIQEMQKTTGTVITITEIPGDKGLVEIFGENETSTNAALTRIKGIVAVPEVGEIYEAKVKSIMPYGAFVEFLPGKDGLLHISEIDWKRLDSMEGIFKEGEIVQVKYLGVDPKTNKHKLSRKVLLPKPENTNS